MPTPWKSSYLFLGHENKTRNGLVYKRTRKEMKLEL